VWSRAIEKRDGSEGKVRTPDLGGTANTNDMTRALIDAL
jgi:isocitrate/isopropylmalate dehydrogenase